MYTAKAAAAFVGAVVTALLASGVIPVDGLLQTILTIISVVATAVVTYNVRNNGVDVAPRRNVN